LQDLLPVGFTRAQYMALLVGLVLLGALVILGPMDPNALYAALNTVAQCAAALAALIGFLGLWRLDRLRAEREQAIQLIYRQQNFSPPPGRLGVGQEIARRGEEHFVQKAEEYVRELEQDPNVDASGGLQLKQATVRWRAIPGEQQQLMETLKRFLTRTLVILFLAISGLVVADALHAWVLTRWLTGLLIIVAAYHLWRDTYAVVREAARSARTLLILALVLLTTPAGAAPRCLTYEERTMNRLQTLCDDGTRAISTYNKTLSRWESTVTPPPGQTCMGQMNPRTRQWQGRCR
jgi:hypothetical protein